MEQTERRKYLIEYLLSERNESAAIPNDTEEQKRLFRALVNIRMPKSASREFLKIQGEYLREELRLKGITDIAELNPIMPDIYLWKGDITTLKCDAIVNAANSRMLGCFCPNHNCIDNAIHTFAGVELRKSCYDIMSLQGREEPVGRAKITPGYNLPCRYIIHTVGPMVFGALDGTHEKQLSDCYRSCLFLADKNFLESIAFCCISTGEFLFPNERAAKIAVQTVGEYKRETKSKIKVIFNVFREYDHEIYKKLLG